MKKNGKQHIHMQTMQTFLGYRKKLLMLLCSRCYWKKLEFFSEKTQCNCKNVASEQFFLLQCNHFDGPRCKQ